MVAVVVIVVACGVAVVYDNDDDDIAVDMFDRIDIFLTRNANNYSNFKTFGSEPHPHFGSLSSS